MFLRETWYVLGWIQDLDIAGGILGRVIAGDPIMVWRDDEGTLHAMEDRCPHRHAPLSLGRVEGATLKCMYHGMAFATNGQCISVPLMETPPDSRVRVYPVVERDDWIWVWIGSPENADKTMIPSAYGTSDPKRPMQFNTLEYSAHYQLLHDNLCDLSHVDFVHQTTLQPASGAQWSESTPRIQSADRAIRFERWFEGAQLPSDPGTRVDVWSTYEFAVPGIFVMYGARFPVGTAKRCGLTEPRGIAPIVENIEQQAVTPISESRTAYHYATGLVGSTDEITKQLSERMGVVMAAFLEDRVMIEAQQKIWDLTPDTQPKCFLPQDRGPFLMRKLMSKLIEKQQFEKNDMK